MTYDQTIHVDAQDASYLEHWTKSNDGDKRLTEDETFSRTAIFHDEIEIDVKCCGNDEGTAWTEAVLFHHGSECACTEPCEDFFGDWSFDYEGDTFIVHVINDGKTKKPAPQPAKEIPADKSAKKTSSLPDRRTNTKVSYLYRDGGNYKLFLEEVFRGKLPEDKMKAFNRKYAEQGFYPSQLQMNDMMTVGTKNGNDPDFHEFTRLIPVEEHATVNKHINEFVEAFETKKCLAF